LAYFIVLRQTFRIEANAPLGDKRCQPTNHLDLEPITALNNGLISYSEVILFSSHDHQFVSTVANRIIELTPNGVIDRVMNFDDYLEDADVTATREALCNGHAELSL